MKEKDLFFPGNTCRIEIHARYPSLTSLKGWRKTVELLSREGIEWKHPYVDPVNDDYAFTILRRDVEKVKRLIHEVWKVSKSYARSENNITFAYVFEGCEVKEEYIKGGPLWQI